MNICLFQFYLFIYFFFWQSFSYFFVLLFQSTVAKINDPTVLLESITFNKREKNEKHSSIHQFLFAFLTVRPGLHYTQSKNPSLF